MTEVGGFWSNAGPGAVPETLIATFDGDTEARTISVELLTCNGSIDWRDGQDLGRVLIHETFRNINKIITKILGTCEIKVMERVGIRVIVLERTPTPTPRFRENFRKEISNDYVRCVEKELGAVVDEGIVLEGKHEDGVAYRVQFGPTEAKNIKAHQSPKFAADIEQLLDYGLFFDIDLFESNLSFESIRFSDGLVPNLKR